MILPGTERGTATRGGVVEGFRLPSSIALVEAWAPSTVLRIVPLPVPGGI